MAQVLILSHSLRASVPSGWFAILVLSFGLISCPFCVRHHNHFPVATPALPRVALDITLQRQWLGTRVRRQRGTCKDDSSRRFIINNIGEIMHAMAWCFSIVAQELYYRCSGTLGVWFTISDPRLKMVLCHQFEPLAWTLWPEPGTISLSSHTDDPLELTELWLLCVSQQASRVIIEGELIAKYRTKTEFILICWYRSLTGSVFALDMFDNGNTAITSSRTAPIFFFFWC